MIHSPTPSPRRRSHHPILHSPTPPPATPQPARSPLPAGVPPPQRSPPLAHAPLPSPPSPAALSPSQSVPTIPRPAIPHPSSFKKPAYHVKKFYVVSRGQEVGIFYDWNEVGPRVHHVGSAVQRGYPTFEEALAVYTRDYKDGCLDPVPFENGPYWPQAPPAPSSSPVIQPQDDITPLISALSVEEAHGGPRRRR
ncbi:hypothetical protein CONPUDRAFT_157215 [Coniophora puteana RWD-64-598 SS2]|uniref:Ribonuclease H1 N-terminal domain-containing protein n=1 Tax=Coniophora puteana (strain RWD-64-598) TaxID=741705 RepID=A0A5M3MGI9_CONPW|nr:uncharacterized protein CONPUDRAFT_157215 [Coniophora puteana RWD-64-598 SS2]EIW78050.1 hypothetical protein CONPUDRAFT_157215 [Coniophora puteana RWD-64-598 SS2]